MLLFRLLTTSLCAACVILLATFQPVRITMVSPAVPPPAPSTACSLERVPQLTVVDVADGVAPWGLGPLIHLRPGERITAVNDRPLVRGRPPIEQIAELPPYPGSYLDLTVASEMTERRVLMLLH
jgi:membrane-associated protease RseP (regulator of RpoE activity)